MTTFDTAAKTDIPVRHPEFEAPLSDLGPDFAKGNNIPASIFIAYLSAVFPAGEDYFVRSIRHYRDQVADPGLKKAVNAFIGQEAVHGREHRELNEILHRLGYPTRRIDRVTDLMLKQRSKMRPAKYNLATTAAIEHFTAVMGELLIDGGLDDMLVHPGLQAIFKWHALEECEHKNVAFDVYQAIGGSERLRRRAMNDATAILLIFTMYEVLVGTFVRDRRFWRQPLRVLRDFKAMKDTELFTMATWRKLRAFNRPGFHPSDIETDHLVVRMRAELFGENGTLTPYVKAA